MNDGYGKWVVKSNDFVQARYDWPVLTHRILTMMTSQINMRQEEFEMQRINIRDVIRLSGTNSQAIYDRVRPIVKGLTKISIEIETDGGNEEGEKIESINVISKARYYKGKGYLEARFTRDMRPFLLQLKKRFTKYELKQLMQLESKYAVRMFELLKRWEGNRRGGKEAVFDVSLEEMRDFLKLEGSYAQVTDFRRYVLDRARKDLKEKLNIWFDYKQIKKGRRITGFKIIIRKDEEAEQAERAKQNRRRLRKSREEGGGEFDSFFRHLPGGERNRWKEMSHELAREELPDSAEDWDYIAREDEIMRSWFRDGVREGDDLPIS